MKNQNKRNRHELKKARESRNAILITAVLFISMFVGYKFLTKEKSPVEVTTNEPEIESLIRSKTVEEAVSPGREPVALYYRTPGMSQEQFCCVGTVMNDREYGMVVVTAEHVFRNDLSEDQQISFKPLRKSVKARTYYFDQIVKTSKEFGGQDAVMATFGTTPKTFKRFSSFVYSEVAKHFYGDVEVAGKKVPKLKSLVSGEEIQTFGYNRMGTKTNDPVFILVEYHSRPGESGTGFVDEHGALWVLHAAPEPGQEELIISEYEKLMHKKIKAATTVCGPFGGNYK